MRIHYTARERPINFSHIIGQRCGLRAYHIYVATSRGSGLRIMRADAKCFCNRGPHQRSNDIKTETGIGKHLGGTFKEIIGEIAGQYTGNVECPPA